MGVVRRLPGIVGGVSLTKTDRVSRLPGVVGGLSSPSAGPESIHEASITFGLSSGCGVNSSVTSDAGHNAGITGDCSVPSGVTSDADHNLGVIGGYSAPSIVDSGADHNAGVASDCIMPPLATADGYALALIDAGYQLTGMVAAGGLALADVIASESVLVTILAVASISPQLSVDSINVGGGVVAGGQHDVVVTFASDLSAVLTANADVASETSIAIGLATQAVAQAAAAAGLQVMEILDVAFSGSVVSGSIVTPDGRVFKVRAETRIFKVPFSARVFEA